MEAFSGHVVLILLHMGSSVDRPPSPTFDLSEIWRFSVDSGRFHGPALAVQLHVTGKALSSVSGKLEARVSLLAWPVGRLAASPPGL